MIGELTHSRVKLLLLDLVDKRRRFRIQLARHVAPVSVHLPVGQLPQLGGHLTHNEVLVTIVACLSDEALVESCCIRVYCSLEHVDSSGEPRGHVLPL